MQDPGEGLYDLEEKAAHGIIPPTSTESSMKDFLKLLFAFGAVCQAALDAQYSNSLAALATRGIDLSGLNISDNTSESRCPAAVRSPTRCELLDIEPVSAKLCQVNMAVKSASQTPPSTATSYLSSGLSNKLRRCQHAYSDQAAQMMSP
jgi:hypothetical protein